VSPKGLCRVLAGVGLYERPVSRWGECPAVTKPRCQRGRILPRMNARARHMQSFRLAHASNGRLFRAGPALDRMSNVDRLSTSSSKLARGVIAVAPPLGTTWPRGVAQGRGMQDRPLVGGPLSYLRGTDPAGASSLVRPCLAPCHLAATGREPGSRSTRVEGRASDKVPETRADLVSEYSPPVDHCTRVSLGTKLFISAPLVVTRSPQSQ
jgi:hypothetical protein